MRAGVLFLSIALLSACSKKDSLDVHTCYEEYLCTSDGAIIKWNTSAINFAFEDTTPTKLRTAMKESAIDYNDHFENTDIYVDENNNSAPRYKDDYNSLNQDGVNAVYYVKGTWPWEQRIPGSLAVTLTRYNAYGILEADVFVKADTNKYENETDTFLPWIKYISEHELGHVLGRSHSQKSDSIMYPSVSTNKIKTLSSDPDKTDFFSTYDLELFALAYK